MTLDEVFYKEFRNTMSVLRCKNEGDFKLSQIPIPKLEYKIDKAKRIFIHGVKDNYYTNLNDTEALLWSKPDLKSRKFSREGFLKDRDGNYVYTHVKLPKDCVALVSDKKIGVPLSYKTEELFQYVDYIENKGEVSYVYIIPKKYCYNMNTTALVLSTTPLRSYYSGISIHTTKGVLIYLFIVPYKPNKDYSEYRILTTKTSLDYKDLVNKILSYWEAKGVIFNRKLTAFEEPVKGVSNCAIKMFNRNTDYIKVDTSKSLLENKDEELFNIAE